MKRAAPLLAVALVSCGSESEPEERPAAKAAAPAKATVDIAQFKYRPARVEVAAGARVTFTNRDRAPHTATAPKGLDTGILRRGGSRTVRLSRPGSFAYICELHPFMRGTVVVRG